MEDREFSKVVGKLKEACRQCIKLKKDCRECPYQGDCIRRKHKDTLYVIGKYEEMLADRQCATWRNYNIIVEKIFNANAKAGYWEIIITHTKPLDNIGTELL